MKLISLLTLSFVVATSSFAQGVGRDRDKTMNQIPGQQAQPNAPAATVAEAVRMLGDAVKTLERTLPVYEFKSNYAMNLLIEAQRAISNNGRYVRVESNRSYQKFMSTVKTKQDPNEISKYSAAQRKESEDRLTVALSLVSRALKGIQGFKNLKSDRAQSMDLCKEAQRQIMECVVIR